MHAILILTGSMYVNKTGNDVWRIWVNVKSWQLINILRLRKRRAISSSLFVCMRPSEMHLIFLSLWIFAFWGTDHPCPHRKQKKNNNKKNPLALEHGKGECGETRVAGLIFGQLSKVIMRFTFLSFWLVQNLVQCGRINESYKKALSGNVRNRWSFVSISKGG